MKKPSYGPVCTSVGGNTWGPDCPRIPESISTRQAPRTSRRAEAAVRPGSPGPARARRGLSRHLPGLHAPRAVLRYRVYQRPRVPFLGPARLRGQPGAEGWMRAEKEEAGQAPSRRLPRAGRPRPPDRSLPRPRRGCSPAPGALG